MDNQHTPSSRPVDLVRLRAARAALDLRILALKSELRARWQRPMASEQRELLACKRAATDLCILRASIPRAEMHRFERFLIAPK